MEEIDQMIHKVEKSKKDSINNGSDFLPRRSTNSTGNSMRVQRPSFTDMKFAKNYLHNESRFFTKNVMSSLPVGKKETFPKLIMLHLQSDPSLRTNEQIEATAKILSEQKIFPEFGNNQKIITLLSQYVTVKFYQQNDDIYEQNSKNDDLLKIYEGRVYLFESDQKQSEQQSQDQGKSRLKLFKEKGEFLEPYENFSQIKKINAKATCKTFLFSIPHKIYHQTLIQSKQNKIIIKTIQKTSIFNTFSNKQIETLIKTCDEIQLNCHQVVFSEGNSVITVSEERIQGKNQRSILQDQKLMYFIVEGQVAISKKINNRNFQICTVGEGDFIGEEAIFLQQISKRKYSAKVSSLHVKMVVISLKDLQEWIKAKALGVNFEFLSKKISKSIKQKLLHYEEFLHKSNMIKSSIFSHAATQSLNDEKREKLRNISNIFGSICNKVQNMEKINTKRLNFHNTSNQVTFEEPLFTRKDFPGIESYLKRFENQEKRALERLNKGRSLHH